MRRLLLTGLLVFVAPETSGQVAFGCVFAFVRYSRNIKFGYFDAYKKDCIAKY